MRIDSFGRKFAMAHCRAGHYFGSNDLERDVRSQPDERSIHPDQQNRDTLPVSQKQESRPPHPLVPALLRTAVFEDAIALAPRVEKLLALLDEPRVG